MATEKIVKDVSPHEFVKAYAAHLKRSSKNFMIRYDLSTVAKLQKFFMLVVHVVSTYPKQTPCETFAQRMHGVPDEIRIAFVVRLEGSHLREEEDIEERPKL